MNQSDEVILTLTESIRVAAPFDYLVRYTETVAHGSDYYQHAEDRDAEDEITIDDLGRALLLEGQLDSRAAQSLFSLPVDISGIPSGHLWSLSDDECDDVVLGIMALARLDGFDSSLATKVLHPKRTETVPVLDSAIYGGFIREDYQPGDPIRSRSTKNPERIGTALRAVRECLRRPENRNAWNDLYDKWSMPEVQQFNMIWSAVTQAGNAQTKKNGVWRLVAHGGGSCWSPNASDSQPADLAHHGDDDHPEQVRDMVGATGR